MSINYQNYEPFFNPTWYPSSWLRSALPLQVMHNKIETYEIIDSNYHVRIDGMYEIDINAIISDTTMFKVNYTTGTIYFDSSINGQTKNVTYMALGRYDYDSANMKLTDSTNYTSTNVQDFANELGSRTDNIIAHNGDGTTPTTLIDALTDVNGVTHSTLRQSMTANYTYNSNKIGVLTDNGITEPDLSTAIKNDRTQLADIALQDARIKKLNLLLKAKNATNSYGLYTANLFADSISEGQGAPDMSNQSYAGILRKMFQEEFGTKNYGFATMYTPVTDSYGTYSAIHDIVYSGNGASHWSIQTDDTAVGLYTATSSTNADSIIIKYPQNCKHIRIWHKPNSGFMSIAINGLTIGTLDLTNGYCTEEINLQTDSENITIVLTKLDTNTSAISGISYYDNPSKYMFNNYGRCGASLSTVDNNIIDIMCDTNILFLGLGTNDSFNNTLSAFQTKLDYIQSKVLASNTFVVILDFIWTGTLAQGQAFKTALYNFYKNVPNSIYISFLEIFNIPPSMLTSEGILQPDGVHPSILGHKIIAEYISKILGFSLHSKEIVEQFQTLDKNFKITLENLTGGKNTVLYDKNDLPSVMVKIPMFYLDDVISGMAHTPHPAFLLDGKIVPYIYVSKYQNCLINNIAYSLPNKDPAINMTFDQAISYCSAKGQGWHLMTNTEWAALALYCYKNGFFPRGNNNLTADTSNPFERGVLTSGVDGTYRVATGSGAVSWTHNNSESGIYDLNGNIFEWVGGLRLNNGEIQILQNNSAADYGVDQSASSSLWKAIMPDGSLVSPGTSGTLKYDCVASISGVKINNTVSISTDDSHPDAFQSFESVQAQSGVNIPDILKILGLAPVSTSLGGDYIHIKNNGERMAMRGGTYFSGIEAGVFNLFAANTRDAQVYTGFRCVYIPIE